MTASELREELAAARTDLARALMPSGRIVSLERLRERQENARWWVAMWERELTDLNCAIVAHN